MMVTPSGTLAKRAAFALAAIFGAVLMIGAVTPEANAASYPNNYYRSFTKTCSFVENDKVECKIPGRGVVKNSDPSGKNSTCLRNAKRNPGKLWDLANINGNIKCVTFTWPAKFDRTYKDSCTRRGGVWACDGITTAVKTVKDLELSCADRARKDTSDTVYDVANIYGRIRCTPPGAPGSAVDDGIDGTMEPV